MTYVLISDTLPYDIRVLDLSDKAFRLYIHAVSYGAKWNLETLHVGHVRAVAGRRARKYIDELVECGLAEWVEDRQFRLTGERDLWKRVPPARRHIPDSLRELIYERDGHACLVCGSGRRLSLDHIHPYSLGGSDDPENLQTLCKPCNSRKGARV